MPRMKLTQRAVDSATAGDKPKTRFMDTELPNFGLRVLRNPPTGPDGSPRLGKKEFILRFADNAGRTSEVAIGDARQITAEEARGRAKAGLGNVSKGADLLGDRKVQRDAAMERRERTLRWVVTEYEKMPARQRKRLRTIQTEDERLKTLVLPIMGDKPVRDIKAADVLNMLERVERERTACRATHARSALGLVLAYALRKDWVDFNAAKATQVPAKIAVRSRLLSDAELKAVWTAEGESIAGRALKLALLTLTRATETAMATWTEFDLDNALWTIPADHTKKHKEHVVHLSAPAIAILKAAKATQGTKRTMKDGSPHPHAGSAWVFPNKDGTGPLNGQRLTRAAARIADAIKAKTSFGPHDLRRTAATRLGAMGFGNTESILARVLSHKSNAGSAAMGSYLHYDFAKEKKAFFEAWAKELLRIVEGREPETNVHSILDARKEREAEPLSA